MVVTPLAVWSLLTMAGPTILCQHLVRAVEADSHRANALTVPTAERRRQVGEALRSILPLILVHDVDNVNVERPINRLHPWPEIRSIRPADRQWFPRLERGDQSLRPDAFADKVWDFVVRIYDSDNRYKPLVGRQPFSNIVNREPMSPDEFNMRRDSVLRISMDRALLVIAKATINEVATDLARVAVWTMEARDLSWEGWVVHPIRSHIARRQGREAIQTVIDKLTSQRTTPSGDHDVSTSEPTTLDDLSAYGGRLFAHLNSLARDWLALAKTVRPDERPSRIRFILRRDRPGSGPSLDQVHHFLREAENIRIKFDQAQAELGRLLEIRGESNSPLGVIIGSRLEMLRHGGLLAQGIFMQAESLREWVHSENQRRAIQSIQSSGADISEAGRLIGDHIPTHSQ